MECGSSGCQSAKSTLLFPVVLATWDSPSTRTDESRSTLSGTHRKAASFPALFSAICCISSFIVSLISSVCCNRITSALKLPALLTTSNNEVPWNMVRFMGRIPPLAFAGTDSMNPSSSPAELMQWVGKSFMDVSSTMMLLMVCMASIEGVWRENDCNIPRIGRKCTYMSGLKISSQPS